MADETERSSKWEAIIPVVLTVLTVMAYVLGALAIQSRRRSLEIELLSGPANADYLYTGGVILLFFFLLAIPGWFIGPGAGEIRSVAALSEGDVAALSEAEDAPRSPALGL